jgi:antitoxin YobK
MTITNEYESILKEGTNAGPATDEMITAAEEQLSVIFPASYRHFLKQYGATMGVGFEIAGLFDSSDDSAPPMWRHVVKMSVQLGRVNQGHLPQTLVPISDDGCGTTFYIDSAQQSDETACSIVAFGPGVDGKIMANSFEEFVIKLATDELEF